jgi:hypothetical protein
MVVTEVLARVGGSYGRYRGTSKSWSLIHSYVLTLIRSYTTRILNAPYTHHLPIHASPLYICIPSAYPRQARTHGRGVRDSQARARTGSGAERAGVHGRGGGGREQL